MLHATLDSTRTYRFLKVQIGLSYFSQPLCDGLVRLNRFLYYEVRLLPSSFLFLPLSLLSPLRHYPAGRAPITDPLPLVQTGLLCATCTNDRFLATSSQRLPLRPTELLCKRPSSSDGFLAAAPPWLLLLQVVLLSRKLSFGGGDGVALVEQLLLEIGP